MKPAHKPLPEPSYRFRSRLLDLLDCPPDRLWPGIDTDTLIVVCPVCDGPLTLRFIGHAARADLECHRGCTEAEVLSALRGRS